MQKREPDFSMAFIDVFFNLMLLFFVAAILSGTEASNKAYEILINQSQKNETIQGDSQIQTEYKLIVNRNTFLIKKGEKIVLTTANFNKILVWLRKTKPISLIIVIDKNSNFSFYDFHILRKTAKETGTSLFYGVMEQ